MEWLESLDIVMEIPATNLNPGIVCPEVFMLFLGPATNISIVSQVKPFTESLYTLFN